MTTDSASTEAQAQSLPVFALPLRTWLVWGPGAALLMGLLSAGFGYGTGLYDGLSAIAGGGSASAALFVAAVSVVPGRAREGRSWMTWLLGAQMLTIVLTVVACLVAWRSLGASIGPLGMTGAASFVAGQMAQTASFSTADREAKALHAGE